MSESVELETSSTTEHELLIEAGFDPNIYRIVGDIQIRRWESAPGEWLRYVKFTASRSQFDATEDTSEIISRIRKHRFLRVNVGDSNNGPRVIALSDWQAGKGEGGGSSALADRVLDLHDRGRELLKNEKPESLIVATLGDMIEGCQGHYSNQAFTVDLDRRSQMKLVRELMYLLLKEWSRLVPNVKVLGIPGNHGENRNSSGKAFTPNHDNDDVAVVEQLSEIFKENPAYDHVEFLLPDGDDLTLNLYLNGTVNAFAHGHQFGLGSGPQAKAMKWWQGQSFGNTSVGGAHVLTTGHYHHFQHVQAWGRTWIQAPSLDGGSKWFTDRTGANDKAGTLTYRVLPNGDGVDHVRVI